MIRKILPVLWLAIPLAVGCAGPAKLTQKSKENLAKGDPWRAWTLATKALDKAPAHPRARAAATAAANTIASDWRRRIRALAETDSVAAAEQVLEFASFRANAARYATVSVAGGWPAEEHALRTAAARVHYRRGLADLESKRPKRAYLHFADVARFAREYRDVERLSDRALERGATRVAFVPFATVSGDPHLGRELAAAWRGETTERLTAPRARFTRVLPTEEVERRMSVSSLGRITRDEALRVGRRAGADRLVWGTIGEVQSRTSVQVFSDVVARRVVERDAAGRRTVRWVDVPIEVVARVRTITTEVEYEVLAARGGATLARRRDPCTMSARALWTVHLPEGDAASYALVSEPARSADPARARQIEARWTAVAGEGTTLSQVLEAKRASRAAAGDGVETLARFSAGAAFVLLESLPPTEELTQAAVARAWKPLYQDLLRLDAADDVDLGLTASD